MNVASAVTEPNKTTDIDSARAHRRKRNDCISAVCDVRSRRAMKKLEGKAVAESQQFGRSRGSIYLLKYTLFDALTKVQNSPRPGINNPVSH